MVPSRGGYASHSEALPLLDRPANLLKYWWESVPLAYAGRGIWVPGWAPHLARKRRLRLTTRLSLFNSPLLLGFDQFERTLDRISKASVDGYPPYNIEQLGETGLRITLAVAGFVSDDLSILVEGNQLVVRGRQQDDKSRIFLHRGIAARQFQRSFVLADGIEVTGASLDNGLLNIGLSRPQPEPKVRQVRIETANTAEGKAVLSTSIEVDQGSTCCD